MYEDPFLDKLPSDDDIFDSSADDLTEAEEEEEEDGDTTSVPRSRTASRRSTLKKSTATATSKVKSKPTKKSLIAQENIPKTTTATTKLRQAGALRFSAASPPASSPGTTSVRAVTPPPTASSTTSTPKTQSALEQWDSAGHWTDKYAPRDITEVAVHAGKIKDVREWLEKHTAYDQSSEKGGSILLLTGPAGSGKTAVLKMLAKEMDIEIVEWLNTINPNTLIQRPKAPGEKGPRAQTIDEEYVPVMETFQRFFARASRFDPLTLDSGDGDKAPASQRPLAPRKRRTRKNIMLLEDFPPLSAYSSRQIFQETITRFTRTERTSSVLVMIISDVFSKHNTEMLFSSMDYQEPALTARTMLPKHVLDLNQQCEEIKFNPIARTIMMKAIKRIIKEEFSSPVSRSRRPTDDELEQFYTLHNGDIRAMLNSLQFYCILPTKKRRHQSGSESDSTDADTQLPIHMRWASRPPMPFNPEMELIEKLPVEPDLFGLMLHQNYPHHQTNISECSMAAEFLSLSDLFSQRAGLENVHMTPYSTSIAIRGVLVAPKGPGRIPQDRKQWWPELLGANRSKRETEHSFNDFAACLVGETAQGYATGCINGPGTFPKSLLRHEIAPMLAVIYKSNPYHAFFRSFPQDKKQFLRNEVGVYGLGKGIQKRKVGEHETGLEDQVAEAAAAAAAAAATPASSSSQAGAEQNGGSSLAGPGATGSLNSFSNKASGGAFSRPIYQHKKPLQFTSTMLVGEDDPIEDFSD
ncbi:Cell cycle checkpoint protein rad17 [Actinomortierella ambigua]|nr:Cell cycle checkpoint protein rad17 [Actinomortierella ambigua]